MKVEVREIGGVTIVDINGKILIGEGDDLLRERIEGLLAAGKRRILLNMAEVPYVDGAGLGELVRAYSAVMRTGGKFGFFNTTSKFKNLLVATKLLTVFLVFETENEAITVIQSL